MYFQDIIGTLNSFWADQGCLLLQPYDTEKGAGTMSPQAGTTSSASTNTSFETKLKFEYSQFLWKNRGKVVKKRASIVASLQNRGNFPALWGATICPVDV